MVLPLTSRDEPALIMMFLADPIAPPLRIGLFVTLGINTKVVREGTTSQDQFLVLFQSELIAPVQTRSLFTVISSVRTMLVPQAFVAITFSLPVAAVGAKFKVTLLPVPEMVTPVPTV